LFSVSQPVNASSSSTFYIHSDTLVLQPASLILPDDTVFDRFVSNIPDRVDSWGWRQERASIFLNVFQQKCTIGMNATHLPPVLAAV
jgi:hypothetical protein